ncbi:hypothetical protein BGZ57DRAFT_89220 [Hyaloscypha finlandica]|nr:hypothetical protein BGZ57DRAFT_89220 [Hyaloscypha finlandica]
MKFSNVIAISLSLGCQVLAAPAPALPIPAPVSDVGAVAGDASAVRSLPVGVPNIAVIKGAVSELRSSVSGELSTITSMSASDAPSYDIPVIKKSLANIATHMKTATTGMAPALVGSTIALTAEEAQAILCALNEIEALVYNIKLALSSLLSTIGADAKALIGPEIATVLELAIPLVAPPVGFVYSILGLVPGGAVVTTELTTVAHSVMGVASTLKTLLGSAH